MPPHNLPLRQQLIRSLAEDGLTPHVVAEPEVRLTELARASAHWDRAAQAVLARDDATFAHEMAEFRKISSVWELRKEREGN